MKKKPIQVLDLSISDTTNAVLQVRYVGKRETTASGGTITVDANGDDSSELFITLVGWDLDANTTGGAAATRYVVGDAYAAGGTSTTVAATLQAVVDAINGLGIGFEARRAHGLSDLDTGTDDWIDFAATQLGRDWTNVLFRDASELNAVGWTGRCGIPNIAGKGRMELLRLTGTATYASGTSTIKVISDRGSAATDEVEIMSILGAATTVEKEFFNFLALGQGQVVNGPIAIENSGAAVSAFTGKLLYRPID